jgi:hypothetical protein
MQKLYIGVVELYKQLYRDTTYCWGIHCTVVKELGSKDLYSLRRASDAK